MRIVQAPLSSSHEGTKGRRARPGHRRRRRRSLRRRHRSGHQRRVRHPDFPRRRSRRHLDRKTSPNSAPTATSAAIRWAAGSGICTASTSCPRPSRTTPTARWCGSRSSTRRAAAGSRWSPRTSTRCTSRPAPRTSSRSTAPSTGCAVRRRAAAPTARPGDRSRATTWRTPPRRSARTPAKSTLPRCPDCDDVLRPHVLWFDEYYADHDDYQWPRVQTAAQTADLLLFIGTSFSVGVTELFLQAATVLGKPAWSIDPSPVPSYHPVHVVRGKAEQVLPGVVD